MLYILKKQKFPSLYLLGGGGHVVFVKNQVNEKQNEKEEKRKEEEQNIKEEKEAGKDKNKLLLKSINLI